VGCLRPSYGSYFNFLLALLPLTLAVVGVPNNVIGTLKFDWLGALGRGRGNLPGIPRALHVLGHQYTISSRRPAFNTYSIAEVEERSFTILVFPFITRRTFGFVSDRSSLLC